MKLSWFPILTGIFFLLQIIMFYISYCLCFGFLVCVMVCDHSLARIAGSNPTGVWSVVNILCCLCDGPITRPEESYPL